MEGMEEKGEMMEGEAPEAPQGGGEAKALIKGVSVAMGEVAKALPKMGASEEDVAAMGDLIGQYQQLIMKVVQGGGEGPAPASPQLPAQAGPRGVPMG